MGDPTYGHSALETICDKLLSSFAFKFNLHHYTMVEGCAAVLVCGAPLLENERINDMCRKVRVVPPPHTHARCEHTGSYLPL